MDPITITFPGLKNIINSKIFEDEPSSSDSMIIFPFSPIEIKFNREFYSPGMTEGRASSYDINQVLTLLELVFPRFPTTFSYLVSCVWRFLLPAVILIIFDIGEILKDSTSFWIFFFVYWGFGNSFLLFQREHAAKKAREDLQGLLAMVQLGYMQRGLRWRIPEQHSRWIELVKEYNEEQNASLIQKAEENGVGDSRYVPLQEEMLSGETKDGSGSE